MNDREIERILNIGEKELQYSFSKNLKEVIVALSRGLPYVAHLLCEELSIHALKNKRKLSISDLYDVVELTAKKVTGSRVDGYH